MLEVDMFVNELQDRFMQVEMLSDEYQQKVIVFIDSILKEAESRRRDDIRSCFGCLKDSPIQVDIEAMRGERVWY